ncbi:MAG: hypothetical protein R3C03_00335 [Pirellulaceae bacterium]
MLVLDELRGFGEIKSCVPDVSRLKPLAELDPESCFIQWKIEFEGEFEASKLDDVSMFFDEESKFECVDQTPAVVEVVESNQAGSSKLLKVNAEVVKTAVDPVDRSRPSKTPFVSTANVSTT